MPAKIPPRRQLLDVLPKLMRIYHIKPWDLDRMTTHEIVKMLEDLEQLEAKAAAASGDRRAARRAASRRKRR